jgi:hypothetical protein
MTFDSLPTELKLNILEELHIAGTQDRNHRHFTNALRVCKEWNELGAPLLWTYIAINNDNLLPFVRSLGTARNTTGAIVRNLSIKLNPMPQGALFSLSLTRLGFPSDHWDDEVGAELDLPTSLPKLSDSRLPRFLRHHSNGNICLVVAIDQLSSSIEAKLGHLITFSFYITPLPSGTYQRYSGIRSSKPHMNSFPLEMFASLLNTLPQSCVQLELRTSRHEDLRYGIQESNSLDDKNDMCRALERVLTRLTHLHLKGENISPFVFSSLITGPTLRNLQSLCLDADNIEITDQRYIHHSGLGQEYSLTVVPLANKPERSQMNCLRLQNLLAKELRKSYDSGRFPAIRELQIIEMQTHSGSDHYNEGRLNTVDIVNQHISVVPTALLAFPEATPDDHPTALVDSATMFWASLPGPGGKMMLLSANEFKLHVIKAWTTSSTGIRVPTTKINDRALQKLVFRPDQRSGIGRSEFLAKARNDSHNTAMWMEEAIEFITPHLRAPYTIQSLLEWYD